MAEKAIHEMVAAYAVGCIDRQNFVQFKDYMQEGGDLPEGELGELQNIIAMIPVILELEKPHPAIKDAVAKKLIGIKDEIKAKIANERNTIVNTNPRLTMPAITEIKSPKPPAVKLKPSMPAFQPRETGTKSAFHFAEEEFTNTFADEAIAKRKTAAKTLVGETMQKQTTLPKTELKPIEVDEPKLNTKIATEEVNTFSEDKSSSNILPIIGLIISLLLITVLGYYVFNSYQKLNDKLDVLQNEVNTLHSQITTANNFVGNNSSLIEFFNYKDIIVFNLISPDPNVKATVKVLFSFGEKEGLVQFKSMPSLQPGHVFQLWMESKGQSYSLGTFQPVGTEYLKITSFPFLPKEQIAGYKITIEQNASVTSPSATLVSSYQAGSARRTR